MRGQFLPEVTLRPGQHVAARVVDRQSISIAGLVLSATLPENVRPNETLRLRVDEVTPERLLLRIAEPQPQAPPAPGVPLPLPDGTQARIHVAEQDPGGGPEGRPPSVTLAYESPALGRIDLRLELPSGAVAATVAAAVGEPAERAQAAAEELRAGLARATAREAQVRVMPRRDPVDVYA